QAEDGIRDFHVTGVQTCALPILRVVEHLPFQQPWIATSGEQWQSLTRPELGRFRYSPTGQVFDYSQGSGGHGYAICLQCGRAAEIGRASCRESVRVSSGRVSLAT